MSATNRSPRPSARASATSPARSQCTGPLQTSSRSFQISPVSVRNRFPMDASPWIACAGSEDLEHAGRQLPSRGRSESRSCGESLGDGRSSDARRSSQSRTSLSGPSAPRKAGQRSVQLPQRVAELPRAARPGSVVVDEPPERHPQAVMAVRPRCHDITRWNGQSPLSQERPDGDLASEPAPDVGVQPGCAGHDPRDHRSGSEMHEHVAAGSHHDGLVAGDGTGARDRPGRRQGTRALGLLRHVAHHARSASAPG